MSLQGHSYVFDVTDKSGTFSTTVTLSAGGPCTTLFNVLENAGAQSPFTITELSSAGSTLTAVGVTGGSFAFDLNARSVTVNVVVGSVITVTFVNSPARGNQGCTPGYFKQSQHFSAWGSFTQTQSVSSVFSGAISSLASESLLDALQGGGGPGLAGAETILLRAAVAALLNASNSGVSYALTVTQVVTEVNTALASGDRDTILLLASRLDAFNNGTGGCPLS